MIKLKSLSIQIKPVASLLKQKFEIAHKILSALLEALRGNNVSIPLIKSFCVLFKKSNLSVGFCVAYMSRGVESAKLPAEKLPRIIIKI